MAVYVIQRGDTLSQIAQRYGTTVQALAQANGISNPDLIRAGATLRIPDARGGAAAAPAPGGPAPTTGAMPVPRPARVAAADPMAAPIPPPNPSRPAPPLPPQNPTRPGVPGPPIDRRSSPTVAGPAPGYQPAGWLPVPPPIGTPAGREWTTRGRNPGSIGAPDGDPAVAEIYGSTGPTPSPSPAPSQTRTASPDMWQGPQGNAYASAMQRRGRTTLTNNDIPDPATLDLRQMSEFEQAWMAAGRRPEELGPRWQQARYLRQQQMDLEREIAMRQLQQQQERDQAMYRVQNGTSPRVAPPAPPVDRSIGEGGYLPNEAVALGQLGASQQNYPGVPALGALIPTSAVPPPPGTPAIGGYYLAPQSQPSLGQLMRRTPASQPYYGV